MKKILVAIFLLTIWGCKQSPTQADIDKLTADCAKTDSISSLNFFVQGYSYQEVRSILVKEIRNEIVLDSFYVAIQPNNPYDSLRMQYNGSIRKVMHLKSKYAFIIDHQKPQLLSGMQMVVRPHFTMTSKDYGCDMYHYLLNGKAFENGNPVFTKEGFNVLERINKMSPK